MCESLSAGLNEVLLQASVLRIFWEVTQISDSYSGPVKPWFLNILLMIFSSAYFCGPTPICSCFLISAWSNH